MEGVSFLLILSGAMFFGSYIAGSIPLMFSLSESRIRLVSIFGAGLLVGTALSVIIPEGVEALYSAQNDVEHLNHHHHNPHVSEVGAIVNPAEAKEILENVKEKEDNLPRIIPKDAVLNEAIGRVVRSPADSETTRRKRDAVVETHSNDEEKSEPGHEEHSHSHSHGSVHSQIGYSLVLGFVLMLLVDQIGSATVAKNDRSGRSRIGISATIGLVVHAADVEHLNDHHHNPHVSEVGAIVNPAEAKEILENVKEKEDNLPRIIPKDAVLNEAIGRVVRSPADSETTRRKRDAVVETHSNDEEKSEPGHEEHSHSHSHGSVHSQIGYSLVLGFVLMLLVDQIGSATVAKNDRSGRSRIGISATIGLVVHAAADGVALGSASVINKSDVQLIVFVAIMLHKAPAAFGLVSFLLMESIDRRAIRKHLIVFSAAAPMAALVTFVIIMHLGESMRSESSTGVLMLFSAGTFLYVATVHVLPELANNKKTEYSLVVDATSPSSIGHSHSSGPSYTFKELLLIIGGAVVPAILASGHSH
uniref:Zinc transporter ZIP9 n=2 Tax=Caenorhabditis japonica TaxID=281687 RepID=A0A8R1I418_CAEJA